MVLQDKRKTTLHPKRTIRLVNEPGKSTIGRRLQGDSSFVKKKFGPVACVGFRFIRKITSQ